MATRTTKVMILALGAAAALTASAGRAAAQTTITSPFGNDPTRVIIGSLAGQQVVLWRSLFSNQCATTVLGNTGLDGPYEIHTGPNTDNVLIPDGSWSTLSCGGLSGGPLNYDGHFLDVYLGSGNDSATAGSGDTYVIAGAGNDTVSSLNPMAALYGDDGDDKLWTRGSGTFQSLFGDAGNDCLQDDNSSAFFDCGTGTDSHAGAPFDAVSCEVPVASCF
jgi:hypothetical protein